MRSWGWESLGNAEVVAFHVVQQLLHRPRKGNTGTGIRTNGYRVAQTGEEADHDI